MSSFHYIDPRGRRSGPYSEAELKILARKGLLEEAGMIELEGVGQPWPVSDVPWLRAEAAPPAALPAAPPAAAPDAASSNFAPPPPPDRLAPPTSPEAAQSRVDATVRAPMPSACSRTVYVLLALLLPFIGVFGVHNMVAGYTTRGVVMLVLSLTTVCGIGCIAFPCTCLSVPIWIVLFTLSVIEAITVTADAQGRPFA